MELEFGNKTTTPKNYAVINGIDIPFIDLVTLLVKLVIASVPATLMVMFLFGLATTILAGFF